MAKRGIRIRAKHSSVKPKLSSGKGGFLTGKVATIISKRKDGKTNS